MLIKKCLICKKDFKIKLYRLKSANFCSYLCKNKAQIGKFKGNESPHWKGLKVCYINIHKWLWINFGKANKCENPNCIYPRKNREGKIMNKPKTFDWAKLKGKKYLRKRNNFWQLCRSCHIRYDQ